MKTHSAETHTCDKENLVAYYTIIHTGYNDSLDSPLSTN